MLRMSEAEALEVGFTHAGRVGLIPIWLDMTRPECPTLCAQSVLLDPVLDVWIGIAAIVRRLRGLQPGLSVSVGARIASDGAVEA